MGQDPEFSAALCAELREWSPRRGPDIHDLMLRAEHHAAWRAPVALASTFGVAALVALLVVSLVVVALGPAIPGGDLVRSHLVETP
jgi:hypothetical protein